MTQHATFSASGSEKWLNCPGSINAEKNYPKKNTTYSLEGTYAHHLADLCLKNEEDVIDYIDKELFCTIDNEHHYFVVDKDLAKFVQDYIDYVVSFKTQDCHIFYEKKVDYSTFVHKGFGTTDSAIYDYVTKTLHVFDLKYGKGIEVSAINNSQMQLYALGFLNELADVRNIVLHIVQPRLYNYSSFSLTLDELLEFGNYAKERSELAMTNNAPIIPGEKQCKFCRAKADCPALFKLTQETITSNFEDLTENSFEKTTNEQKRLLLENKDLIIDYLNSIEQYITDKLGSGEKFEGFKLVEGRSVRKWNDGAEAFLFEKLGDNAYKKSLITITEASSFLAKKEIDEITFKPQGKPKIVPSSDKRPEITNISDLFDTL